MIESVCVSDALKIKRHFVDEEISRAELLGRVKKFGRSISTDKDKITGK